MTPPLEELKSSLRTRLQALAPDGPHQETARALVEGALRDLEQVWESIADRDLAIAQQKKVAQGLQESMDRMLLLEHLAEVISCSKDIGQVLRGLTTVARRIISFDIVGAYLTERNTNGWVLRYASGIEPRHESIIRSHINEGVISWVMLQKRPVAVPNLLHVTREQATRTDGFIITPMLAGEKRIGFVEIWMEDLSSLNPTTHLDRLDFLARQAAIAIDNSLLYEEVHRSNELFRQSQSQIIQSEKMAAMGIMASGMAHEINNPLQIVLSQVQFLIRKAKEEHLLEGLRLIEHETVRMGGIVGSMLRYSRQQQQTSSAPVKIEPIIKDVLTLMRPRLVQHKIQVVTQLSEATPEIRVNAGEIEQVFLNLVENAIHAMTPNGQIFVRTRVEDKEVVIEVEDTGCGIPKEILPKIFVPFFTTKGPNHGTGLGLFLCHSIVERHGGTIRAESAPGRGTSFTIRFPVSTSTAKPDEKNPAC